MRFEDTPNPDEAAKIDLMVQTVIANQKKQYKEGSTAKRFLHGKSLGVANAIFSVNDDLPDDLRIGLFARTKEYRAVIRFSNGALKAQTPDILPNVRGMAVKIFEVSGAKVLPGEEQSQQLDLILANDPTFFAGEIDEMLSLVQGKFGKTLMEYPGTILRALKASNKLVTGVLDIDYFSQVPYQFGDRACKFALSPVAHDHSIPNIFDKNYLRHGLEKQLRKEQHSFIFKVQFQLPGESISDSTEEWKGPFIPMGELKLLQINQKIRESDGEDLVFNPFRTLAVHQPLGWPGRARKAIYAADAEWRHEKNSLEKNKVAAV